MKPRPIAASRFALPCFVTVAFLSAPSLHAASATWNGTTDATWATLGNWAGPPASVPTSGETATFNNAGGAVDIIDLGAGVTVRSLTFDTASAAYTIGSGAVSSQTLTLENGGSIIMNSAVAANQTFNALVSLGDSVASYTITNNSITNSLNFGEIRRANDGSNFALNVSGDGTINADRIAIVSPGGGVTTLAKTGTGTLNLSGAADNRNLNLTVGGGIVVANKASSATVKAANLVTVNSGGTLQLAGTGGDQINNTITVSSGGVLDLNGRNESQTTTRNVVLNGTGIGSAGALVNSAASTTSILSFATGQVTVASAASIGGVGNITIDGQVQRTGGAGLTKVGSGTLTLSGTTDNASNILFVSNGTVVLNKTTNATSRAASTATVNGGILQLAGDQGDQINSTLTVNGGFVDMNGRNESLTAIIAASFGGTIYNTANSTTSTITLTGGGSGGTYAGVVADNAGGGQTGTMILRQNNGGITQTLTGTNTYTGGTRVSSGTLALSGGNNILADTGTVNLDGATGIFDISAVTTGETIGSLSGLAGSSVVLGSKTLTVGNATNTTYAGAISGSFGSLTKQGTGNLTLTGINTYTGATAVRAGALLIGTSGSLDNTAVTVGGAAATGTPTLGGGGTIAGATTIAAAGGGVAGTHAPGVAGVGSQIFSNNLTYQSGSIFEWDINTAADTSDSVSVGGSLSVDSGAILKIVSSTAFTDVFWDATRNWNVFGGKDFDAFTLSFVANNVSQVAGDFAGEGNFTFTNSGATLTWTAVPEPTSALAGLLIGAGLLRRRRI